MSETHAVVIVCCAPMEPSAQAQLADRGIGIHVVSDVPEPLTHDAESIAQTLIDAAEQIVRSSSPVAVAYYASGVAGAAALMAGAQRPDLVAAIVAINARTDRAFDYLRELHTPTFLLVTDMPVLLMNREAVATMKCEKRIEVIHGTTCAAIVTEKAVRWLSDRLAVLQPA
jgi:hypothetical protein